MATKTEQLHIIDMLERGQITAGEATQLLDALADDDFLESGEEIEQEFDGANPANPEMFTPEPEAAPEEPLPEPPSLPPELRRWRQYWLGVFLIALGALVLCTFLMYQAYSSSGYGFWFFCSWVPFLLSVGAVALAWQSRTTPWLHLRVQQAANEWPRRISFSFPLPLGLVGWLFHNFGHYIPQLERSGLDTDQIDKLIYGLKDYTSPDNPLYIEVDEEDGDRVLIYIG
jgi:hypothetical protein